MSQSTSKPQAQAASCRLLASACLRLGKATGCCRHPARPRPRPLRIIISHTQKGGAAFSAREGDSRIKDPGDDGEPGDLAVNIGDLTTPEDSSLAERNREAVQHLYQPYYLAAFPPPPHHACFRKLFDAERQNSGQDPWIDKS